MGHFYVLIVILWSLIAVMLILIAILRFLIAVMPILIAIFRFYLQATVQDGEKPRTTWPPHALKKEHPVVKISL